MHVYVLSEVRGDDLAFRMVSEGKPFSPVYVLARQASRQHGNPYLMYGPHLEEFFEVEKNDCTITVLDVTSGYLEPQ